VRRRGELGAGYFLVSFSRCVFVALTRLRCSAAAYGRGLRTRYYTWHRSERCLSSFSARWSGVVMENALKKGRTRPSMGREMKTVEVD
jgi:hypothetical protein